MKRFCILIVLAVMNINLFGQIVQHHGLSQSTQHHHGMDKVPLIHWKFYGGIGTSTYYGRVTTKYISDPSYGFFSSIDVRPTFSLGAAYKFHDHFFVRAEITNYWIGATEGNKRASEDGRSSNYTFRANNFDFSLLAQFNILPYTYLLDQGNRFVPYVFAGIGFTTNTPQVLSSGQWVNLNSLTDKINTPAVGVLPFGLGVSYRISGNLEVGVELAARYTLSQGIDGLTKDGAPISSLNQKGADYFSQNYSNVSTNLAINAKSHGKVNVDKSQYNDVYTMVQIKVGYTIIPPKFQHLFDQKNLNFSNKAKGQKTKRDFRKKDPSLKR